jgi:hypothetical protein
MVVVNNLVLAVRPELTVLLVLIVRLVIVVAIAWSPVKARVAIATSAHARIGVIHQQRRLPGRGRTTSALGSVHCKGGAEQSQHV